MDAIVDICARHEPPLITTGGGGMLLGHAAGEIARLRALATQARESPPPTTRTPKSATTTARGTSPPPSPASSSPSSTTAWSGAGMSEQAVVRIVETSYPLPPTDGLTPGDR